MTSTPTLTKCPDWCDYREEPEHRGSHRREGTYVPASRSVPVDVGIQGAVFPAAAAHLVSESDDGAAVALHVSAVAHRSEDLEISFGADEALALTARMLEQIAALASASGPWGGGDPEDVRAIEKYAAEIVDARTIR